jgi:hypothetical protein
VQDKYYTLFEDIEGQDSKLDQVVETAEQCLEGPVAKKVIQEFTEKQSLEKQQVKEARAKLEAFEVALPRFE